MTAEFGNDLDIATARNLVALWRREIGQEKTARLMALLTLWLEEWPYQRAGTKAAELREAGKMPDDTSSGEIERPLDVVALQAEDKHLWARAVTLTEAMFQSALRRLHAAVEGNKWAGPTGPYAMMVPGGREDYTQASILLDRIRDVLAEEPPSLRAAKARDVLVTAMWEERERCARIAEARPKGQFWTGSAIAAAIRRGGVDAK